jgi:hypothetical protein
MNVFGVEYRRGQEHRCPLVLEHTFQTWDPTPLWLLYRSVTRWACCLDTVPDASERVLMFTKAPWNNCR